MAALQQAQNKKSTPPPRPADPLLSFKLISFLIPGTWELERALIVAIVVLQRLGNKQEANTQPFSTTRQRFSVSLDQRSLCTMPEL